MDVEALKSIKLVATDVDGTLTLYRGSELISEDGIKGVRLLESNGIKVSLITGNALPVAIGLATYLGASGPVAAENGCVIFYNDNIYHLCSGRPDDRVVDYMIKRGFRPTWQNTFRFHELAFKPAKPIDGRVISDVVNELRRMGYNIVWSGYAIHVQAPGGGKDVSLRMISKLTGIPLDSIAAVGDGDNDVPMLTIAGFSAAPSDASEAAKRAAKFVASSPGGRGFLEVAELILRLYKNP